MFVGKGFMRDRVRDSGLTLIECLAAFTVVLVGVFVIMGVISTAFTGVTDARNIHLGTQVARENLDAWLQKGYTWVASQPASVNGTSTITNTDNGVTQTQSFNWTLTHQPSVAGGVEEIDVSVTWRQKGGIGLYTSKAKLSGWLSK